MKPKQVFDPVFKKMAVDLSYAKGSVRDTAKELNINDPNRITHWRRQFREGDPSKKASVEMTEDQKELKRVKAHLQDIELENRILKKALGIFSRGDGRFSGL